LPIENAFDVEEIYMPLDGIALNAVVAELQEKLIGGKVDKIFQPERDELIITIRNLGQNLKLLLSSSPNHARLHLTETNKTNPLQPPMFCMLLRKHLTGAKIIDIQQPDFERIVEIVFESTDELGDIAHKTITIEIMGRHSNIIFKNQHDKIIDSIRHVSGEMSRVREVLPGCDYQYPPSQGKRNPLHCDRDFFLTLLLDENQNIRLDKYLSGILTGVSITSAKEIVFRSLGTDTVYLKDLSENQVHLLAEEIQAFFSSVRERSFSPVLVTDSEKAPIDFLPMPYRMFDKNLQYPYESISQLMDYYYFTRDQKERLAQKTSHYHKVLRTNLERCYKKLELQQEELRESAHMEEYRLFGELLTANIYRIKKGMRQISVENYWSQNGETVSIPLDEQLSPAENAQKYFKLYAKAKKTTEMLTQKMKENKEEITYLENQLYNLEMCNDESAINEIRDELVEQGYIKPSSMKKKDKGFSPSKPYHYLSSEGYHIFVGKNNVQNDYLTLKTARPDDIWLHTKDIPGSHVIIKLEGKPVPERTLWEAAILASYYSKAQRSSNVPVDYTLRKYVKKPGGAKPGMVIYVNQKTLYVTPEEKTVQAIKKMD